MNSSEMPLTYPSHAAHGPYRTHVPAPESLPMVPIGHSLYPQRLSRYPRGRLEYPGALLRPMCPIRECYRTRQACYQEGQLARAGTLRRA